MTALYVLFALLVAADGWTTWRIMKGGGKELNPVMRWLFARLGLEPAIIASRVLALVLGVILAYAAARQNAFALYVFIGVMVAFGLVVANNLRVLKAMNDQ